jgi:Rieske Fe-S protein
VSEVPFNGVPVPTRRAVLLAGAGGAGIAVLAACSPGGGNPGRTDPSSQPANQQLTTVTGIHVGGAVSVTLRDGQPAIVSRPTPTTVACFSAICTHQGCTVLPVGDKLECPCHGSVYNAFTGQVLQGPAAVALPKIPVKVTDGKVVTASSA